VDLWFSALAAVGFTGSGELSLYRQGAGYWGLGTLAGRASEFRAAFQADSSFELLHFVPLYFAASDRAATYAALRQVAEEGSAAVPRLAATERFGAYAVASVVRTSEQRRTLGRFVAALEQEWAAGYAQRRMAMSPDAAVAAADSTWRAVAPALTPYLRRWRLDGGRLFVVPALGPDGRLFEGVPAARDDNALAVALPLASPGDAAYFAVRELCYPAVREAVRGVTLPADRVAAEALRGRAAVRCGALLLGRAAPAHVERYRAAWLRASGSAGSFEAAFAIPDDLVAALERTLGN
jgi:hypothetical protein